ncbi:MAG TPA: helix-turn-helix transcriptional regulator [Actinoplanes sp.]
MTADHGAGRGGSGFDAVLRDHRLRAGLTQEELAARAGIGVRTVRDLERGRASRPQRTTVGLLADALRLTGPDRAAFSAAARGRMAPVEGPATRGDVVSLRDAVAAGYALLAPAEQQAVRRLAMFQNRWSLALAEQIVDAGPDVMPLLDRLLKLDLLSVADNRIYRFRLVDVVRDFATERAAAQGELVAARRRHALVMADLAGTLAPGLAGSGFADAAAQLDVMAGDLAAALAFGAEEDPRTALRIAVVLPRWWRFRGREATGRQWMRRLLRDPRTADADPGLRSCAEMGLLLLAGSE